MIDEDREVEFRLLLAWHFGFIDPAEMQAKVPTRIIDMWWAWYLRNPPDANLARLVAAKYTDNTIADFIPIIRNLPGS